MEKRVCVRLYMPPALYGTPQKIADAEARSASAQGVHFIRLGVQAYQRRMQQTDEKRVQK
nr:hypothetical protein [Maliibacterium massiliense]